MARRVTIAQQAEGAISMLLNTASRLLQEPPPNLHGMSNRVYLGADKFMDILRRKGLDCGCSTTITGEVPYRRYDYKCVCKPTASRGRPATPRGLRGFAVVLSGKGCRDKEGAFVPVPQCRRVKAKG